MEEKRNVKLGQEKRSPWGYLGPHNLSGLSFFHPSVQRSPPRIILLLGFGDMSVRTLVLLWIGIRQVNIPLLVDKQLDTNKRTRRKIRNERVLRCKSTSPCL